MGGPCEQGRYGKLYKGDKETYIDSREESPLGPVCCLGGEERARGEDGG